MKYDVIIIGSGVAGMSAALYLKRANINTCIIEKNMPGGQINYTSTIENYPGFDRITGPELALNMYKQIRNNDIPLQYEQVTKIEKLKSKEIKITTDKKEYISDYLIIATGKKNKKLNIENEDKLISHGISYCAICDGALYKNENVCVIGGGESALEEALYLSNICSSVTIISRNEKLRATKNTIEQVNKKKNIKIIYKKTIKTLVEKDNKLEEIILNDDEILKVKACVVYIGSIPNNEFLNNIVEIKEDGYINTDELMQTSNENIYAIGDIRKKNIYQIISAINDGLIATNSIIKKIQNIK